MTVHVEFRCGGCEATAWGTDWLRWEFRSFGGRSHGVGNVIASNTVEDVCPEGWVACDPYTHACYCPECWVSIMAPEETGATP